MSDAASPVIILAFANDRDAYLKELQAERAGIFESLQGLDDRGAIEVHKQEETTIEGLFKTLNRYADRVAIVHFASHADGAALQLEAANGAGTESAFAAGLAGRFGQLPALQLVFLNGCATRGQVETLLKAGVRAVIATSVRIDDTMATGFAKEFYAALASSSGTVSIADAFETARTFVATRDPLRQVAKDGRGFLAADEGGDLPPGLIWGPYPNNGAAAALDWRLPMEAASPTDILVARITNGSITMAEARLIDDALGVDRSAAAASPIPDSATKSFADTVTSLATTEDPADRAAAISVVRGDDAGAYDQLFASAEAETAKAAELGSDETWTLINLCRLHRTNGDLARSLSCAQSARQHARNDRDRSVAVNELGDIAIASGDLAEARWRFTAGLHIGERFAAADPANSQ